MPSFTYETRTVPIDTIWPDPENCRVHDQVNLDAIRASIQTFGQVEDLVTQKGTGKIIGGNGRYEVMKALGREFVTIKEVDVNDVQAKALSIALNRTGELARWDDTKLTETLRQLQLDSCGVVYSTGYSEQALSQLLQSLDANPAGVLPGTGQGDLPTSGGPGGDASSHGSCGSANDHDPNTGDEDREKTYAVAVFCNTKEQRKELMERLKDEGYEVKESRSRRPED